MNVIIVIPAYKPQRNKMMDLLECLYEKGFSEVVVVNDGSGEEYIDLFSEIEQKYKCTVLNHNINLGKGRALKTAFNYCIGLDPKQNLWGGVITVDADGQHHIDDIVNVAKLLQLNPNRVILGCRQFDRDVPLKSRLGNKITRMVFKWLCGVNISDTQTGLRGIPFVLLPTMCRINGEKYEYETDVLLALKENDIEKIEVPIKTIYEDNNACSHFNPFKDSIRIYKTILKYSLSSLVTTLVDFIMFFVSINFFSCSIVAATYIGRSIATVVNFTLNRRVVFKSKNNVFKQFIKFLVLVFIMGTISGFSVSFIANYFALPIIVIKCIVEVVLYFVNYYIQNMFIFK